MTSKDDERFDARRRHASADYKKPPPTAQGPRDAKGRSLRELDLRTRLFRYPCSFLIYGEAFEGLPASARQAVYERMWNVLSGRDTRKITQHLSAADRQAILQILRDTKADLPESFK